MLRTSVKIAVAVLATGVAVSACGSVRMGAAAIAGNQRIASATLNAQVANLDAAYRTDKKKIQISFTTAQMPQLVLSWLIRFQVRDALARRDGIGVTQGDIQRALDAISAEIKQESATATLAEVAVANGIPPDLLSQLGRYQAVQTALVNRLDGGKTPTKTAAQAALQTRFDHAQCLASKSLNIKVNPQYGVLDYSQLTVVAAPSTLSRQQTPSPSPSSTPLLKPAC